MDWIDFSGLVLGAVFTTLAGLHFYWAIGGTWGFNLALPMHQDGRPIFIPKARDCMLVGLGLALIAGFYFLEFSNALYFLPVYLQTGLLMLIPSLFLIRAIGEFKYVGFFKQLKNTAFGKRDSYYYSPLCLFIGILGCLVYFLK